MSEIHLHLHFPPGVEVSFDGQTLTAKPAQLQDVTGKPIDFEWTLGAKEPPVPT